MREVIGDHDVFKGGREEGDERRREAGEVMEVRSRGGDTDTGIWAVDLSP